MIETIIFDLDGTLLNSVEDIRSAINITMNKYKFPTLSEEEVLKILGYGSKYLIEKALPIKVDQNKFKEIYDFYIDTYNKNVDVYTKPYDGILDLLKYLKDKNYKLALLSNKDHKLVVSLVNNHFPSLFSTFCGTFKKLPTKPDPYLLNQMIEKLNTTNRNTLYVGDTEVDYMLSKNAKTDFLCVSWGFRSKEELKKHGIKSFINKPEEIISYLNKKVK